MGDKEYASLYAVAKICGFDNSFDDVNLTWLKSRASRPF